MKKEVEIKILNIDPRKLRVSLKKLRGVQVLKRTFMREFYFESPTKERLYSSFRLRAEGQKSFLTLKLKKEDKKFSIRNEYEVEVSDFKTARSILELAGFKVFRKREKKRESYRVGHVRIEIDEYPKMRPYMEIEASSKEKIEKFLKKMGFNLEHATKKAATEVIRDAGLNPDNLTFSKK